MGMRLAHPKDNGKSVTYVGFHSRLGPLLEVTDFLEFVFYSMRLACTTIPGGFDGPVIQIAALSGKQKARYPDIPCGQLGKI